MNLKSVLSIFAISLFLISCSKDDDNNQSNNPYIPKIAFDTGDLINTDLPQYSQMQYPVNYLTLNNNYGYNGVVIYYAGNNNYSAFELSDPNHALNSCSQLTLDGDVASCSCEDGNSYSIASGGLPLSGTTGQYTLIRYNVEVHGSVIRVYN